MAAISPQWQQDAAWFPHRLHWPDGIFRLVRTSPEQLRTASFLDGRSVFWDGAEQAGAWQDGDGDAQAAPPLYLFHQAFCGSTLLASLIDRNCRALALKEPQALVDVADGMMARERLAPGLSAEQLQARGDAAVRLLFRRFDADEPVLIKPSNWVNSIAPMLMARDARARCVLLTIDRGAFLRAVFRGGRDRMAFTARAAAHFASGFANGADLLRAAIGASSDPLAQMAHLAALAHGLQDALFDAVRNAADGRCRMLDFVQLQHDPGTALEQARLALRLMARGGADAIMLAGHAKQPDRAYDAAAEARLNAQIDAHHGRLLDAAQSWADTVQPVRLSDAG